MLPFRLCPIEKRNRDLWVVVNSIFNEITDEKHYFGTVAIFLEGGLDFEGNPKNQH